MSKKALYIGIHHWNSPFQVGSHGIVKELIHEGWKVAYISAPISPLHLLGGISTDLKSRWNNYKKGGENTYNNMLWHYTPFALLTPAMVPILSSTWLFINWAYLSLPNIITKIKKQGFGEVDLLFLDSLFQPFWLDTVNYKHSVLRLADNYSGFQGYNDNIHAIENTLIKNVDNVIVPAKNLKKRIALMNPKNLYHIPNGINFNHFSEKNIKKPEQYAHIPEPRIIYVGAIQEWFDFELVKKMAIALNDVSIVLIGPTNCIPQSFYNIKNIYIMGIQTHEHLPSFIHYAQIGIIPFNIQKHPKLVHDIHPLKLYEYFACGIPVVSTDWEELRLINSPAILCDNNNDFIQAIVSLLNKTVNIQVLKKFAKKADWKYRVKKLLHVLEINKN